MGILLAVGKIGHDTYANEITLINRIYSSWTGINQTIHDLKILEIIPILACFSLVALGSQGAKKMIQVIAHSRTVLLLMLFLTVSYLFQIFYYSDYSGGWPTNIRYDFPGIISKQLFWIVCLIFISQIANAANNKFIILAMRSIKILIVLFLIYSSINSGFQHIINSSKGNVLATSHFTSKIRELSRLSSANPTYPVVIRSIKFSDFEPIHSMERYIKYLNIKNPLYLDYTDYNFSSRTGLSKQLTLDLIDLSTKGSSTVRPIASLKDNINCISVLLGNIPDTNKCAINIRF